MDLGRFEMSLNVADLDASKEFYEILGFTIADGDESEGWLLLQNGSLTLGLYQGHVPSNAMNFRGGDVFALADELQRCGLKLENPAEVESDGSAGAWLKDPDGNLIYLNTAPGETNVCRADA